MLPAATDALSFTAGLDQAQFNASRLHQAAVIRCLAVIGEAANKVSRDYQKAYPKIDWREIVGRWHRLIHNYAAVRLDVVWNVLQNDLPGLIATLRLLIPPGNGTQST